MKSTPAILVLRVLVVVFSASLFGGYVVFTQHQAQSATPAKAARKPVADAGGGAKQQAAVVSPTAPGSRFMLSGSKTYAGATMVTEQLHQLSGGELSEVSRRRMVMSGSKSVTVSIAPGLPGIGTGTPEVRRVTEGPLSPVIPSTGTPDSGPGYLMALAGGSTSFAGAVETRELREVMTKLAPQHPPRELMLDFKSPAAAEKSYDMVSAGIANKGLKGAGTAEVTFFTDASGSTLITYADTAPAGATQNLAPGERVAAIIPTFSSRSKADVKLSSQVGAWGRLDVRPTRSVVDDPTSKNLAAPARKDTIELLKEFFNVTRVDWLHWSGTDERTRMGEAGALAFGVPVEPRSLGGHAFFIEAALRSFDVAPPVLASTSKSGPVLVPWQGGRSLETGTSKWRYYTGAHWDLRGAIRDFERRFKPSKESDRKGTPPIMPGSKLAPVMTELPDIPSVIDLWISSLPQAQP